MNWKKSMAVLGLSACFLAMTIPAMAADELKSGEKPSAEIRENSMMTKNLLAMLVTDGTISESTYDAIEEYLQQNPRPSSKEERLTVRNRLPSLTEQESLTDSDRSRLWLG